MVPQNLNRRFKPQPIETSQTSSKRNGEESEESTQRPPRKFAVEPVETSSKSSKENGQVDKTQTPRRKFAPEPVEMSSTSSKKEESTTKPRSRFAPQPLEMSTSSSRRRKQSPLSDDDDPPSPKSSRSSGASTPKPKRKFAPDLIDTSSRSRKASDSHASLPTSYRTDAIPGHVLNRDQKPATSNDSERSRHLVLPHERRRDRPHSRGSMHSRSFRMPDLETIESSESEPSDPSTTSSSPSSAESPLTSSDVPISETYKHATRIRESIDESFGRYMLELEARKAERKLQEAALAAFANSDYHEPVEHYVGEDDDSEEAVYDDRPTTWEGHEDDILPVPVKTFRQDTTKMNWELQEMKQHHETLEQERKAQRPNAPVHVDTQPSPWWNPAVQTFGGKGDPEMSQMRDRARPPMLGDDLRFPRSASPEPARFDVTQGSHVLRSQMCYLTQQSEASTVNPKTQDGLWGGENSKHGTGRSSQSQGLWGGFCVGQSQGTPGGLAPPIGPTGLLTPMNLEPMNPFDQVANNSAIAINISRPPSPPNTYEKAIAQGIGSIDRILNSDEELDRLMETEYPDTFITQVFNYLSLGYPTLARPFDDELSKISRVPVTDLRHDDAVAKRMPKGYIRLGDDFEGRGDGSDQDLGEDGCARWRALKMYIKEWARQEKGMAPVEAAGSNFGTAPRRGSWAW